MRHERGVTPHKPITLVYLDQCFFAAAPSSAIEIERFDAMDFDTVLRDQIAMGMVVKVTVM